MKTITIKPDEKFYAAIGEYRTLYALPKYIIESMPFDTYKEAVDYINDTEELETLLDSTNQTLLLKVLTTLKEKQLLKQQKQKQLK